MRRILGNDGNCANCISMRALKQKTMLNKLEFTRTDMYYVVAVLVLTEHRV